MVKKILGVFLLLLLANSVFGHDQSYEFSIGLGETYTADHYDQTPFKGYAFVTVTNTGALPWGDFHFEIVNDPAGSVAFEDASMGGVDPTLASISGTPGHHLDSWTIDNNAIGARLDAYYYSNPIQPGDRVLFTVWTDNTAQQLPFFGIMMWPTPVPEPVTMGLLALGSLLVVRRKK